MALRLCVVVYDLEKIMFGVFEDHEYTFLFKDNLNQVYQVWMRELGAQGDLTDGGLREPSVLNRLSFLVGFESGSYLVEL
jgi:hypothetical protein